MAITYIALGSVTVGAGGAANIEFTSIPQTYTDLCLFFSLRSASNAPGVFINFNSSTSNYSQKRIQGDGSTIASYGTYAQAAGFGSISTNTVSTFGNSMVYIPNYTSSNNKSYSAEGLSENNATTAYIELGAGLWSDSSAITSIKLVFDSSGTIVQHSTATLYGIKNT